MKPSKGHPDRAMGPWIAVAAVLTAVGWLAPSPAFADEESKSEQMSASGDWLGAIPDAPTEDWKVAFGGRLYDNWFSALVTQEPESTHPAYPSAGKQKRASTWRCKECHGWD